MFADLWASLNVGGRVCGRVCAAINFSSHYLAEFLWQGQKQPKEMAFALSHAFDQVSLGTTKRSHLIKMEN